MKIHTVAMRIFKTSCGNIGKTSGESDDPTTVWLVPDCLNVFHWQPIPERSSVDWSAVTDVDLGQLGYSEISDQVYMRTNEIQLQRNEHDPCVTELASEHAMFTRAQSDNQFVQDVHVAVRNWPAYIPRDSMGRRLWETVNRIAQRAALDEDNKRFLSASSA